MRAKVFVSFARVPAERDIVLSVCELLRDRGIEVALGLSLNTARRDGGSRALARVIAEADAVLVICTEAYWKHWQLGNIEPEMIASLVLDGSERRKRVVPLVFTPEDKAFVPGPFRSLHVHVLRSHADFGELVNALVEPYQLVRPPAVPPRPAILPADPDPSRVESDGGGDDTLARQRAEERERLLRMVEERRLEEQRRVTASILPGTVQGARLSLSRMMSVARDLFVEWFTYAPQSDPIAVTATVPRAIRRGCAFNVSVAIHIPEAPPPNVNGYASSTVQPAASLRRGAQVAVAIGPLPSGFTCDAPEAVLVWNPPRQTAAFDVLASPTVPPGRYVTWAAVSTTGKHAVEIVRVSLELKVKAKRESVTGVRTTSSTLPTDYFASYARRDSDAVLGRVASLTSIGFDVFVDCADVREGASWDEEISTAVTERSGFLLFWSTAASKSAWVEKEWRLRLQARGLASIRPNALELPEVCPPPNELRALQFGSLYLHLLNSAAALRPVGDMGGESP